MAGLLVSVGLMLVLLGAGVWIAFAIGLAAFVAFIPVIGGRVFDMVGSQAWGTSASFTMTAVPLFVFMAEIIASSGISDRAYVGVSKILHGVPGGLHQSNIAACAVFAAISGSSVATAATVSRVAYPEMLRRGYDKVQSAGSLAAGGTLGILIPPSIPLIVYGELTEQSVGKLFLAGLVPGVILAGLFMSYIFLRSTLERRSGSVADEGTVTFGDRLTGLAALWPLGLLIVAVLGSIYLGITTATEAAGLGAVMALALAAAFRRLNLRMLREAGMSAVRITAMIMLIVMAATLLSKALAYYQVPTVVRSIAEGIGSPLLLFIMVCALYVVMGCFFDGIAMILITLPFILPAMRAAGFDLIWFGIILVILIEMGLLTPPVGINLFVLQGSTNLSLMAVARGSLPFLFVMCFVIVLLVIFPNLALWLPSLSFSG